MTKEGRTHWGERRTSPINGVSITSHQSEWPSAKNQQMISAGEDVEKREPSCTVGGNVN